jgi:putative membrane protein
VLRAAPFMRYTSFYMNIFLQWIVSAIAIGVAAYLIPGVTVDLVNAFVLAIVLGLINAFLRPIISILTLPLNIVTLGLFSLVTNALLVMLADYLVPGFSVDGFVSALLFAIVISLVNWLFLRGRLS